jgi:predicted CoA-binding protein
MPSPHEAFWTNTTFAVVGRSASKPFPALTYNALKAMDGKTVYAVDPSRDVIEGDASFKDLASLPTRPDAVVLEVPAEETASWVEQAADAGITKIWIHMGRETPEALAVADQRGLELCTGTCAVQYLRGGFPHNLHRLLRRAAGRW